MNSLDYSVLQNDAFDFWNDFSMSFIISVFLNCFELCEIMIFGFCDMLYV